MISRRRFMVASLLGLSLAPAACKDSDTVLLVLVAGPRDVVATHMSVTVTAGMDARNFTIPRTSMQGDAIVWPCSFTLSLDRSQTGPIAVSIDALDAQGSTVGYGTTTMEHIQIGGQTSITVMLTEALPPDTIDGGAGGQGGAAGEGGSSGAGGQGGAAGQDASSPDAPDAANGDAGLDGGTD